MREQELTKQQAAELHLPPRNPFDQDEVLWGPRLRDPATEFYEQQQAA